MMPFKMPHLDSSRMSYSIVHIVAVYQALGMHHMSSDLIPSSREGLWVLEDDVSASNHS